MKASRSSKTAEQMALSRALEFRRPASERICSDPFAERFLGRAYRGALIAPAVRAGAEAIIERLFPGHHHYVLARTRYIDDFLRDRLAQSPSPEQLVILGAGFDSRAHRFVDALRHVSVFEVDHPATSRAKQAILARMRGDLGRVQSVPVNFDTDDLPRELTKGGYRPDRRTIFLWEGVTPYLSAAGVDATLGFIRTRSAAGSVLLFDYVLRSAIAGTCDLRGARNEVDRMKRSSEPFVFGIDADTIGRFLTDRGFTAVHDVGSDELGARYLHGARAARYIKPWWRIVHAAVA